MFGSSPFSALPLSTSQGQAVVVMASFGNLTTQIYSPQIIVMVEGAISTEYVNTSYLVGTDAILTTKPSAVAITFIHGKYIYSKVNPVKQNIQVELKNKQTGKPAYLTLAAIDKMSGGKNIQLEGIFVVPISVRLANGKAITIQKQI